MCFLLTGALKPTCLRPRPHCNRPAHQCGIAKKKRVVATGNSDIEVGDTLLAKIQVREVDPDKAEIKPPRVRPNKENPSASLPDPTRSPVTRE